MSETISPLSGVTPDAGRNKTGFALITRFSLRIDEFLGLAEINSELARDNWFRQRSRLFNAITYPSVCNQDMRPDKWYLLMSEGDQRLFDAHVKATEDWIVPLYFKGGGDKELNDLLYMSIADHFNGADNLLISRIDNDDALDRQYVAKLRNFAASLSGREEIFLLFRKGLRWDGHMGEELVYENGPFLTMYSPNWKETKPNPLLLRHTKVLDYPHMFVESSEPMWLQSIHGENLYNAFKNRNACAPVALADICAKYRIDPGALDALRENSVPVGKEQQTGQTGDLNRKTMFFPSFQDDRKKKLGAASNTPKPAPQGSAKKPQQVASNPLSDAAIIAELREQVKQANDLLEQEKRLHMATKEHARFYRNLVQEFRDDLKRVNALKIPGQVVQK